MRLEVTLEQGLQPGAKLWGTRAGTIQERGPLGIGGFPQRFLEQRLFPVALGGHGSPRSMPGDSASDKLSADDLFDALDKHRPLDEPLASRGRGRDHGDEAGNDDGCQQPTLPATPPHADNPWLAREFD